MRLRIAFKLHGEEAELARQISAASGVHVDAVAKLAMQRYMKEVMTKATELAKQYEEEQARERLNEVHPAGTVPSTSDSVPSQAL